MRIGKARALAVAVVVMAVAVTGVAGALGSSGAGGTIALRNQSDWTTFDFQVNTPGLMWYVQGGYDRLVSLSNGKIVPYLATSWKVKPKSITFQLRKGAKCANGNLVTPNVVASATVMLFLKNRK